MSDPGAKRQLEYEVASSCLGEHRMQGSRNNVVRLGPISQSNTFIALAELTFEFIGGSLAMAPASYKNIFGHTVAGRVQLYGDDMGISEPVKSCLPYAVVTGPSWQAVDRSVDILKEAIDLHIRDCGRCGYITSKW